MRALLRLVSLLVALCAALALCATGAYADDGTGTGAGFSLALNSWPVLVAGALGIVSTNVTAFLTHRAAPQWIKSGVNLALVSLAGVIATIQLVPGHMWKDYAGTIFVAWVASLVAHGAGLTQMVSNLSSNVGIGATVEPLVSPPTDEADAPA